MKHDEFHSLSWANTLVKDWFQQKYGEPSPPQIKGWPSILAKKNTLISAPTGTGKTLAAFLICINRLIGSALLNELKEETQILYISPLKALSNDVQKNLANPLFEMSELAKERGIALQEIRVSVRTGDTPSYERQKMLKKPPHILVTTPESLYILLTAEKSREMLSHVQTVIVDEIHAMANSKRGSHLALSLERLEALCSKSPLRIGLSATQKPIEKIASFLTGANRPAPHIIQAEYAKNLEITVETPQTELSAVASNEMWDEIYDRIAQFSESVHSLLVFVNTRRLAERVAHHLSERIGTELVATHHGSLSYALRLSAETRLKNGELKILVATASLELGIDIGAIDLVCQIGSPRAIAIMLQRAGRAGHYYGALSKAYLFATTRDELIECAALVQAIREKELDAILIPEEPLDILSQQIVAMCSTNEWREEELFSIVKNAYPYRNLTREKFDSVIAMLSQGIAGARNKYGAYLYRDAINGIVKGRRNSKLVSVMNGGAIPENALFTAISEPDNIMVGTLDEDFAIESHRGDIILLGTTSWRVNRIDSHAGKIFVENAHGAPPNVPFWQGEAPGRTLELSARVSDLKESLDQMLEKSEDSAILWLKNHCGLNQGGSRQLLKYLSEGKAVLQMIPTQKQIIAERFFDESGGMQLIIHAPFGARINKAWGLALRKRFCRTFNFELQAAATDNGISIALTPEHSFPLTDVFHFLNAKTVKEVLIQAVLQSPIFITRWRWAATRSLAICRFRNGKKIPPHILRMLSDDLLAAVFPDAAACQDNLAGQDIVLPDHPLTHEAMKDVLTEAMDIDGLIYILQGFLTGEIQYSGIDTPIASVFSHEILNANPYAYLDDAPLEERRSRAVEMRHMLPESFLKDIAKLDPDVIHEVEKESWPDIRDDDELHDLLNTLIVIPENFVKDQIWSHFLENLIQHGRAGKVTFHGNTFWISAENKLYVSILYPDALFLEELKTISVPPLESEDILVNVIKNWLSYLGPTNAESLKDLFQFDLSVIENALLKLEASGAILRGYFKHQEREWCDRRILARIHKRTIAKLRKDIRPFEPEEMKQWLLKWQHVALGSQLCGKEGLLEVIRQLQGVEMPANVWEQEIFAKRVSDYHPEMLDYLCLTGAIGWGRFSAHPALISAEKNIFRRVVPTSRAPIAFFLRDNPIWVARNKVWLEVSCPNLSHSAAKVFEYLKTYGASFFLDIVHKTNGLKAEIETALWELTAAGLVTADTFDNLRGFINKKRRLRHKKHFPTSQGRWAILNFAFESEDIEAFCWVLLKRYGIVFRDLLVKEKLIPPWKDLIKTFRRMEARGEIRGGNFVIGYVGEQFALPYALESLRAYRKELTVTPHKFS